MKTKIILLLTLLLAMTQGVMAWEGSGSGTATDPYRISSTQDLKALANEVVPQGTYFSLTADIDLGGDNNDGESNFTPIGTTTASFNGVFLGNNHTISGVRIKQDVNGSMNVGLFGVVGRYATVKDLTLASSFIEGGSKVGGIVGSSTWSGNAPDGVCTIENCRVVNTTVRGSYSVGAIIGEAYATVTNCHVATDVTVRGIGTNSYIGGVAGDMNRGTIAGCASAAAVSAEVVTPLPSFFGGIVGAAKNDGSVTILDNLFLGYIAAGDIVSRGSIVGAFYSGTKNMVDNSSILAGALSRNFYIDKDLTLYASKGVRNSDVTTDNGAVQATASVLNDIFVYEGTVTNYQHDAELGTVTDLTASDNGIDYDGTFYYVGSNSIIHFAEGSGSDEDPFLISNTAEWNKLALATNSNSSFNSSPRYLKQTGDVSVTIAHMVGTAYPASRPFTGYYDGNGQTLTVDLQDDDMTIIAPFRYISGATIENLYVTGTVYGSNYTAGLVGQTVGSESVNTVANCRVSADVWTYNKYPTSTVSGGIVYNSMDGTLHITGCLFEGKLASGKTNETMAGTIVGVCSADDEVKHCLDNRTDAGDNNYVQYAIAWQGVTMGNQFTGGDPSIIDHSYSTHSSASIECCTFNVGMELGGDVVTYSVSGITGGAPGVQHTDFSKIVFVEKDEVVRMKLTPPHGYEVTKATMKWNNYDSQETLAKDDNGCYTFTVPTAAIEYYLYPESDYTTEFEGSGTEQDPYLIYNTTQLNSMSSKINSGEGEYYKAHYKLMDDIGCWDDFVPIGKPNSGGHYLTFQGTFDGNGHTVFNIRLTRTGTDDTSIRLGLFGYAANGAVIKNVIISNSTFQGYQYVGAILGYGSNVTIENCHVKNNVSITTYEYPTAPEGNISYHGGIAGHVSTGTIKGCTSAAQFSTLSNVGFTYTNWGGIVGYAGTTTIQDCVYTGNGSSNTSNRLTAICGGVSGCTLSNNLFTNTTLMGVSTGNVEEGMNIDEQAQPGYRRGKKPAYIGDVATTYYFAENKPGTVAYTAGVSYDGSYYVRSLVTKNVAYIDADGNEQHVDAYVLDGTEDRFDSEWFVAEGDVNYDSPVMVTTNAKLILADGSRLTFATPDKTAIESEQETSSHAPLYDLAIFGQSEQTGQLTVTMSDGWDLGIQVKDYFQYGGDVTITAPTEGYGNGIMAGRYSTYTYAGPTGNVLMKRGKLTSNQTICANGKIDVLGGQTDVYSLYAALAYNKTDDEYVDQFRITLSWASPYDKITVKNYKVVYAYKGVLTNKTENGRIWLYDDFVDSQWNIEKQYIHNSNVVESGTVIIDGRTLQPGRLTLSNDAENATLLPLYDGLKMVQVTLKGRNLYKDKNWNTLCLPFSLTEAELSDHGVLKDYDIRALNSSSFANGTLTLNFSTISETAITAGEPYLVKWTGDYNAAPFEDLTFSDVTISKDAGTRETAKANLVATFEPVTLEANDKSVLFLGSENKLYWPTADVTVGAFRAYFELNGITAGDLNANPARAFVLNFGNGETTAVSDALSVKDAEDAATRWYTLDGRQIDGKPTQKGLYINKGKKVIIK